MKTSPEQFEEWLHSLEGEHFEFKEAKRSFCFDELTKYCAALANEGGGKMILGVTDRRPRQVVGTTAFDQLERTRRGLHDRLHISIDLEGVAHPDGRVLVIHVPSRPTGTAIKWDGVYWARETDKLVPMSEDRLRRIFAETGHDFSADVCPGTSLADLDSAAVEEFRKRWIAHSGNQALANPSQEQLLHDAEALVGDKPTYAAMVLFGTRKALGRHQLGQAEVVFEYRSSDATGPAADRQEWRAGFFSFYDDLWSKVNLRNDLQHYQEGLFVQSIPTFEERPIREAILNAVSHRDYQLGGSIFVRQFPRRLEIISPGGLPVGVTLENILDTQVPRNRRIADIFHKCGLVERSGQGVNFMFEDSIRHSKPEPDFTGTDAYRVAVTLQGTVQDASFLRFLERVGQERTATFGTRDWQALGCISQERDLTGACAAQTQRLLDLGVIERISRGRFMLSRKYYSISGREGEYTRKRGLDRETNKQLLLKHVRDCGDPGAAMGDFMEVLPALSRRQVRALLRELGKEGNVHLRGQKRGARWYVGPRTAE